MSELDLTRETRAALKKLGVWTLRVKPGARVVRRNTEIPRGTPDLIGRFPHWHPCAGRMFAVENKASHSDKCRCVSCAAQREWRLDHERDGGIYVFARTVDAALTGLGIGQEWCG